MNSHGRKFENEALLTYEEVSRLLRVDPETGELVWLEDRGGTAAAGSVAGLKRGNEYRQVKINGIKYSAHRIVWLIIHGAWPTDEIDHKNGVKDDNRPVNLRVVSHSENHKNQKRPSNNTTGVAGVCKRGKRYQAQIVVNNVRIHIGFFDTVKEATRARRAAERKYGFAPTHGLDQETREMLS